MTMDFRSIVFAIALLIFAAKTSALNSTAAAVTNSTKITATGTKTVTNTTAVAVTKTTIKSSLSNCTKQSQCAKTHFCNTKLRICSLKLSLNSTCSQDKECSSNKCHDKLCRQSCSQDKECSTDREYCTISHYCAKKHCGACIRNAQCANNKCHIFRCSTDTCTAKLNALKKSR
ncbi:unnamed protein product [Adineta ricciae]|uniref:Uncharacterized protein n=1 Tax=Adineta ricciae TaxID=249248 RepID=A0A813YL24_ADIRI|nr:unnamed protein product [Adineta ricciae]CAF1182182.1 unnamed protein product [Adineta ricciae]